MSCVCQLLCITRAQHSHRHSSHLRSHLQFASRCIRQPRRAAVNTRPSSSGAGTHPSGRKRHARCSWPLARCGRQRTVATWLDQRARAANAHRSSVHDQPGLARVWSAERPRQRHPQGHPWRSRELNTGGAKSKPSRALGQRSVALLAGPRPHAPSCPPVPAVRAAGSCCPDVCVCVCVGGWQVARFETVARRLGIMDNVKAGVPRVAYHGVVTVRMHGRKVHVSPPIRDIKF